jgi:hypothetical protein
MDFVPLGGFPPIIPKKKSTIPIKKIENRGFVSVDKILSRKQKNFNSEQILKNIFGDEEISEYQISQQEKTP